DLNMGWFSEPARRAMLVHTRAYGWYNGLEPVIQREERFSELNLIGNYAPVKTFAVKVTDEHLNPVENAQVEFQLYNYAEFYPIARNKTDKNGITSITSGLGDLIIWAAKDNNFAYKEITVESTDTLHLQLASSHPDGISEIYDLVPPVERKPHDQDDKGNARNAIRLHTEDSIRLAYMETFKDSTWAAALANTLEISPDSTVNAISLSYGNWNEISDFLNSVAPAQRHWALRMVSVITDKDIRDTRAEILRDHLQNALPFYNNLHFSDPEFFAENVMSGRISNEMMISWRAFLQTKFDKAFALAARNNINIITGWIEKNITIDNTANLHSRAPLTPRGVYELKIADEHSRDIFFIAVCRSLGIPARINQATSMPQYFTNNEWTNVPFNRPMETANQKGFVHFLNGNDAIMPKYAINFTIARLADGFYRTLEYEYETKLDAFPEKLEVESGNYMLVTGNRQTDGSVLSSITFFKVNTNETSTITVNIRETGTKQEPWALLDVNGINLTDYKTGQSTGLAEVIRQNGVVMVWIDPDKEPSRHVMIDIPAVRGVFEHWGGSVIFLLDKNKVGRSFRPENFPGLPAQAIYVYDNNNMLLDRIEKLKGHKLTGNLPVIVVSDVLGNLVYFSEGYKIGVGEQLAKEIGRLK
ncbi:MAG TPA: transglutaminase domain-containing protein, partial [Bacteroidales bacterium]